MKYNRVYFSHSFGGFGLGVWCTKFYTQPEDYPYSNFIWTIAIGPVCFYARFYSQA